MHRHWVRRAVWPSSTNGQRTGWSTGCTARVALARHGAHPLIAWSAEQPMLGARCPRRRFDTAYVEVAPGACGHPLRSSGAVCATRCRRAVSARRWRCGQEVDSASIEIRWAGEVVGRPPSRRRPGTIEVWDADHCAATPRRPPSRDSRGRHLSRLSCTASSPGRRDRPRRLERRLRRRRSRPVPLRDAARS